MVDKRYFLIIVGGAIAVGLQPNGLACASAGGLPGAGRFADGRPEIRRPTTSGRAGSGARRLNGFPVRCYSKSVLFNRIAGNSNRSQCAYCCEVFHISPANQVAVGIFLCL
ncbi:hypothetical protein [Methylomonas koyamae]|uniref:hypothetical protein n=1 Tax=Methylomonas koyamae TaxID=702114 RepID=UPI002872F569|nr:hypothetical protein [Methylomonas koyamae]WNB77404.1 hypothetical protein RI210_07440 [Methylomonas koyamae]